VEGDESKKGRRRKGGKTNLERHPLRLCPQPLHRFLRKLLLQLQLRVTDDLDDLGRDASEVTGEEDLGTRFGEVLGELGTLAEDNEGVGGGEGDAANTVVGVVLSAGDGNCGEKRRSRRKEEGRKEEETYWTA